MDPATSSSDSFLVTLSGTVNTCDSYSLRNMSENKRVFNSIDDATDVFGFLAVAYPAPVLRYHKQFRGSNAG